VESNRYGEAARGAANLASAYFTDNREPCRWARFGSRFHRAFEGIMLGAASLNLQPPFQLPKLRPFQMSDFKGQELQVQGRASDLCFRNLFEHVSEVEKLFLREPT
jgi:hypothetical protein